MQSGFAVPLQSFNGLTVLQEVKYIEQSRTAFIILFIVGENLILHKNTS